MKNIFFIIITAFVLGGVMFIQSCDDTLTNQDIDEIQIPAENVSYQKHIQPLFNLKCAHSGCHNSEDRAANLDLTSYGTTISDLSIIVPGDAEGSRLVWSIKGETANPMPPLNYPQLTQNQIQGIITWINEGAEPD
jgi:hypothetical protein